MGSNILKNAYELRSMFADICRRTKRGIPWHPYTVESFGSERTDTQGYFMELPECYVFAFRGTEPRIFKDVITDAMAWKKVIPYGNDKSPIRVHYGFLRAYKSVRDRVHRIATERLRGDKPLVVVGHSLGGALATLCAVDMQYMMEEKLLRSGSRVVYCFTYGSPRVGNRAFAKSYDNRVPATWRFQGAFDIITHMGPSWLGYRHVRTKFGVRCSHNILKYIGCMM